MSSSSIENITTEESKCTFKSRIFTGVSAKPKTEFQGAEISSQDDRLRNQDSPSQAAFALSKIDSSSAVDIEQNGSLNGLNKESQLSHSDLHSENNRGEENAGSLKHASSSRRICRFYSRNGFCGFGDTCRYSHSLFYRPPKAVKSKPDLNNVENEISEQETTEVNQHVSQKQQLVCKFFARRRYCRYGQECKFSHQISISDGNQIADDSSSATVEATLKELEEKEEKSNIEEAGQNSNQICRLFSRYGRCRFGPSCKFRHVEHKKSTKTVKINDQPLQDVGDTAEKEDNANTNKIGTTLDVPKSVKLRNKKASDMSPTDFAKLRETEITQLKRKFPKCIQSSVPDIGTLFDVEFRPTDPDWRFDVKSINISVMIPETYPEENLQVDLQNPEGVIPEKLIRYFNKTTFVWLQEQQEKNKLKDEVVLIFRPFLKWLDKSLEDIFIAGLKMVKRDMEAKAAGIEFVTHQELNANNKSKETTNEVQPSVSQNGTDAIEDNDDQCYSYAQEYDDPVSTYSSDFGSHSVLMENVVDFRSTSETAKRGTEIKLRHLELLEGAASLTCSKLSVTVQCGRCKMRSDLAVAPHRGHHVVCERCHHQQKLIFRSQMLHQHSSVAGYLDLDNCQVVDIPLLTCEFALQCLPCGRQNLLSGVQYSQNHITWCLFCHSKMVVSVESVKLNQLQPNVEPVSIKGGQVLKLEKREKRVKDPAVQEGKPLPENGTCKHYKKSFRWLRFPCCGKTYPCDLCHDEKETDHDMKFATRMLCGFCAKEQPYSKERPCVSCSSDMTKKSGAHWEGGKGCRDKIKMSKDDHQKYVGCNKTVSRKLQPAPKKEK